MKGPAYGYDFVLESLCVLGNVIRQEFQSHKAVEFYVFCFVDDTHPAATQLLNDAVVRDGPADHWRESYVGKFGKSMKAACEG